MAWGNVISIYAVLWLPMMGAPPGKPTQARQAGTEEEE